MIKSLFYVSQKTAPWPNDGPDVDAITAFARARNPSLDITGALISTDEHFSQVLEGPAEAVDAVMASIYRDPRHCSVNLLQEGERKARWFAKWSLAYAGRSSFVALKLSPLLLDGTPNPMAVEQLLKLIKAFGQSA